MKHMSGTEEWMRAGQQTMRSLSKKGAWQLGHSYDLNLCCYRRGQRQKPMFAVHASGGAEQSLWKLLCIGGAAVLCFCALCRMAACVRRMLRESAIRMRERCYWRARLAAQKQAQ